MVKQLKWRFLGVFVPSVLISVLGIGGDVILLRNRVDEEHLKWHRIRLISIIITYTLAVLVNPGRPPKNFEPDESIARLCTFCKKCNSKRPPRSHHCRICNQCVLRMDHHCPWTNNCVGHRNLLHFVRFLTCATWGLCVYFVELCGISSELWSSRHQPMLDSTISKFELTTLIIFTPTTLLLAFSIFILWVRSIWDLCLNITLIETWEKERAESQYRQGRLSKTEIDFPFDLGSPLDNLQAALGPCWFWCIPFSTPDGDGIHFLVDEDSRDSVWPPPDPDQVKMAVFSPYRPSDSSSVPTRRRKPHPPPSSSTSSRSGSDSNYSDEDEIRPLSHWNKDKWESQDGEKLEDFGVDLDAELDS
ncbi:DHHC palmitoyltransferase-domain-containing protein [Lipomyces oligophaga]|uniref:DHHC palmitoyltransferase-domain-containing protein n=1 Tax=Lipomyces oligophaga TaxID=45792 RepID=UPI0034CD6FB1